MRDMQPIRITPFDVLYYASLAQPSESEIRHIVLHADVLGRLVQRLQPPATAATRRSSARP